MNEQVIALQEESETWITEPQFDRTSPQGRKNMDILTKLFEEKSPKKLYKSSFDQRMTKFKSIEFERELNTLSIQHRKHDFVNNNISGAVTSKRYKGSRTEFEKSKIAKHNRLKASERRGSTMKSEE